MHRLTPLDLKNYLHHALEAAKRGAALLKAKWGSIESVGHKGTSIDLVTDVDRASEKAIIQYIKQYYPAHSILAEESGMHSQQEDEFIWMIDPLDGTTNYTHQYPVVAVSIALLFKGEPVVGVVYNPIMDELFQAAHGMGATLNGQPLRVSQVETLERSLLASGFPYDRKENPNNNYGSFCRLTHLTQGVRRGGAASIDMAYVAAGRLEGYWEGGIKPWDVAAGVVLVLESGGRVSAFDGTSLDLTSGKMLATNGRIHSDLIQELLQSQQISISL